VGPDYSPILDRLSARPSRRPQTWIARCPVHRDRTPSLSLWIGREGQLLANCWTCRCGWRALVLATNTKPTDWFPPKGEGVRAQRSIVATYDYRDEGGRLLYQKVRYCPKGFRLRRWDGSGWKWDLSGVERVPYRLPEILAQPNAPVCVCYSQDTEVLTRHGWVSFPLLTAEMEVAQYHLESGSISFHAPTAIQQLTFAGDMIHFSRDWCDLLVTPDHRMLGKHERCQPRVLPASEVGRGLSLPVAGIYAGREIAVTPNQVRLLVAFAADGNVAARGRLVNFRFKKPRKIARCIDLLTNLHIPHTISVSRDETIIRLSRHDAPFLLDHMPDKAWTMGMLHWPTPLRMIAIEEIAEWDGTRYGKSIKFETVRCGEADAVAAVAACTGYGCLVHREDRGGSRQPIYHLSLISKTWRTLGSNPRKDPWTPGRIPYHGKVYCCTVPSGFLVVRRNGKTTIAGNCEGEKDCNALHRLGLLATCNDDGAENWSLEHGRWLAGRRVAILPDNDAAGLRHAVAAAGTLIFWHAESIRLVSLPDLPEKGDVSDWLARFGSEVSRESKRRELCSIIRQAPEWRQVCRE